VVGLCGWISERLSDLPVSIDRAMRDDTPVGDRPGLGAETACLPAGTGDAQPGGRYGDGLRGRVRDALRMSVFTLQS